MENQFTKFLALFLCLLCVSCSGLKKQSATDKNDKDEITLWLNSTLMGQKNIADNEVGTIKYPCYASQEDKYVKKNDLNIITSKWEEFCGEISNFSYEEGYTYKLKLKKLKSRRLVKKKTVAEREQWQLLAVLAKEKDLYYEKVEEHKVWIGPKLVSVKCASPLAPADCTELRHQMQRGNLDVNGKWQPMYDIYEMRDYAEGYIYEVQYTKRYNADAFQVMDGNNFTIEDFKVISKKKL